MAVDLTGMPDGVKKLPQEYKKTNEGIERLIEIMSKNGGDTAESAKLYKKEFAKLARQQAENQKNANAMLKAMREAGVSKAEREAWIVKKSGLYEGDKDLYILMKSMQSELKEANKKVEIKDEAERTIAEAQVKTLEKYLKNQEKYFKDNDKRAKDIDKKIAADSKKPKVVKWLEEKGGKFFGEKFAGAKEGVKTGAKNAGSTALTTLLGPLRLITDPLLSLAGTNTHDVFDKLLGGEGKDGKKKKGSKSVLGRYAAGRAGSYGEEYDFEDIPRGKKTDDWATMFGEEGGGRRASKKAPGARMPGKKERTVDDFLNEETPPGIFENGRESDETLKDFMEGLLEGLGDRSPGILGKGSDEGLMDSIQPTRSSLLKRGGIIGAAAIFLADAILGGKKPGMETAGKDKEGGLNILGLGKGGIKGLMAKWIPVLKVAAPFAIAAAGAAMAAGGMALQKRDTKDAKKYADEGKHGRAVETFLLGDREHITEETAGKEMGRAVGKNTLLVGGAGLMAAGGAGVAAMGSTVATAGGVAAAGGLGAVGSAGLAAVGAAIPPVLITAAIVAAATAVAKGTQEAYELQYDKNAATIQRELNRTFLDEEKPFLKRVGASFKSDWIKLTSTLAGGIRGAAEVLDVEAEREMQTQLGILKKQADEGNAESARLYEIMSQQSFREMNKKEQEQLLRSEALYDEYITVVGESQGSLWDKIKKGAKTVVGAVENAAETANQNAKGEMTAAWEKKKLKNMDKIIATNEDAERLKNSEIYQKTLEDTGNPLKAMQEAFLDEQRELGKARGDLDANDMVVGLFDRVKLGFKSFTDISDEAIKQSTEFDTRRLQLLAQGKTAEEADQQAMEEQRDLLTRQMELRLKQTKEYKAMFDKALKEGKSLKEAEKEALSKVKGNRGYLRSFGETLSEGLKDLWEGAKDTFSGLWDRIRGGRRSPSGRPPPPDTEIHDGIVYKGGKVIAVDDDDNIIATKNEPFIGDRETRRADAVPVMPDIINKFSDANIVDVLSKILAALEKKDFSPVIKPVSNDNSVMDFDGLRMAGVL